MGNSHENAKEDINKKEISRRDLLKILKAGSAGLAAITLGGTAISSIGYLTYKRTKSHMQGPYSPNCLFEHIPTLKEIILEEGEKYFSYPETKSDRVNSLDEMYCNVYPQVRSAIDGFLNEKNEFPSLHKLSYLNFASLAELGLGTGFFLGLRELQNRAKIKTIKKFCQCFKYLIALQCGVSAIEFGQARGFYNPFNGKVSIGIGNPTEDTKSTIAHELGHKLLHERVKGHYPGWINQGFAEGFSWAVLNHSRLIETTKNKVREESLIYLVSTYKLVCSSKGVQSELSKEFDEFDYNFKGIRVPDDYSMGYTFFRIREREKGSEMYRKILKDGNLKVIEPIPAANTII